MKNIIENDIFKQVLVARDIFMDSKDFLMSLELTTYVDTKLIDAI